MCRMISAKAAKAETEEDFKAVLELLISGQFPQNLPNYNLRSPHSDILALGGSTEINVRVFRPVVSLLLKESLC